MSEAIIDPTKTYKRYMASGYGHQPAQGVDRESNVIQGVSVCTMGEAKGHGVHLDSEFIAEVQKQGAERKMGIKCRFGHPNMCNEALGTHVGWFKNFTTKNDADGNPVQVFADLHISEAADDSPKGELGSYLLKMAEKEGDAFGTSIVFTPGNLYRRGEDGGKYQYNVEYKEWGVDQWYTDETGHRLSEDEVEDANLFDELFVECESLHACDAVDEPAANEGLFSTAYGQGELAAKLTEFLDLNTDLRDVIESNQESIPQFLSRYFAASSANQNQKEPEQMATNETQAEEVVTEPTALSQPETPETPAAPAEPVEPEALSDEPKADPVADLQKAVSEFGAEIATKAFGEGGGYEEARELHFAAIAEENAALKASKSGTEPVDFGEGEEAPKKVWKNL